MLLFGVYFILYFLKLSNISEFQTEHVLMFLLWGPFASLTFTRYLWILSERDQLHVFIFDFDHIEQIHLVFLLLILEMNLTVVKLIKEEHDTYQNQQLKV